MDSHEALIAEISRRGFLQRAGVLGLGALVLSAVPVAEELIAAGEARGAGRARSRRHAPGVRRHDHPGPQGRAHRPRQRDPPAGDRRRRLAPGRGGGRRARALPPPADRLRRARAGRSSPSSSSAPSTIGTGDFVSLNFDRRVAVCKAGLDFANPARVVWEAAAAVPFTAFCAAALVPEQRAEKASGYRVMGLPGRRAGRLPALLVPAQALARAHQEGLPPVMAEQVDVLIAGTGFGGSITAYRLAELYRAAGADAGSVLVLDKGPRRKNTDFKQSMAHRAPVRRLRADPGPGRPDRGGARRRRRLGALPGGLAAGAHARPSSAATGGPATATSGACGPGRSRAPA